MEQGAMPLEPIVQTTEHSAQNAIIIQNVAYPERFLITCRNMFFFLLLLFLEWSDECCNVQQPAKRSE